MQINFNNIEYKLHIIKLPISLSIKITNNKNNLECIVIYIPCDNVSFDYNIVSNNGMQEDEIKNVLELFNKQIVKETIMNKTITLKELFIIKCNMEEEIKNLKNEISEDYFNGYMCAIQNLERFINIEQKSK